MARPETAAKNPRGASAASVSWKALVDAWRSHHQESARDSLQRLLQAPIQNLMTALVIGITLALPMLFAIALDNIQTLGRQWDGAPRLSVFLKTDSTPAQIESVRKALAPTIDITDIAFITPEQALADFEKQSGIEGTLEMLDKNPLPPAFVVTFATGSDTGTLETIRTQWQALPGVDVVQADLAWVKKLNQLLELGRRIVIGLAAVLGAGALLSVGNTIRLAIENRRSEIVVATLVGATDAFVRRPFLYTGFWYGLAGGIVAIVLVEAGYHGLVTPVAELATLYQSDFVLQGLDLISALCLFVIGIFLGMLGAWVAVAQHLHNTRPR